MEKTKFESLMERRPHLLAEARRYRCIGRRTLLILAALSAGSVTAYGQTDPWSNAATKLGQIFSGPIAKGLALVALVVGGLQLAFGDGSSSRTLSGIIFGLGLALGAANFAIWLFT